MHQSLSPWWLLMAWCQIGSRASATAMMIQLWLQHHMKHADGLVQDCSISIANTLEILQSSTKPSMLCNITAINTLRLKLTGSHYTLILGQNGRHFPDDILKWIVLNESVWILINNSLKFVPMGLINNIPALVQIMAWRHTGDKPLYEPMLDDILACICVTWPQWVKTHFLYRN